MGARAHVEVVIRSFEAQFVKEDLGHFVIIVLACVDENFLNTTVRMVLIMALDGFKNRGKLDELGPGTNDVEELEWGRIGGKG
jgi:hypothetical protein